MIVDLGYSRSKLDHKHVLGHDIYIHILYIGVMFNVRGGWKKFVTIDLSKL